MKYRVFALLGVLALSAGSILQAQDYDDIYYDASKSKTTETKAKNKAAKSSKTAVLYGEVPEQYRVAAQDNYRLERDVDEYNRRGAYAPGYEIDINGDTIYEIDINGDTIFEEAFANTRLIERFYNPDIVILSDDDDLVELYYDESPSVNLIIGSDWGYSTYGWNGYWDDWSAPWYSWNAWSWYDSWYHPWHNPWYNPWYNPWRYSYYGGYYSNYWHWGWHYSPWYRTGWGWDPWYYGHHNWSVPSYGYRSRSGDMHFNSRNWGAGNSRAGLATNRNHRSRLSVGASGNRNSVSSTGRSRSTGVGSAGNRPGYATSRSGNMGSRNNSGVTTRSSSGYSRGSSGYSGGSRSSSSYGSSRSSSSSSGTYRSSSSGGSYSGGGSSSRGGSGSSGGGSHGGSSGGGGHRR